MPITGGCLCEAVQYEITGPCSNMLNCHCAQCRKSHGSAFVTFTAVKQQDLRFTRGESHLKHFAVSQHFARNWCDICGSTMPFLEGKNYSVPAGTIHGAIPAEIVGHIFTDSKASWYQITDTLKQYHGFPKSMQRTEVETNGRDIQPGAAGSCLCGACQFSLQNEPLFMMNCHCDRCKRSRGAAHATNLFYARSALTWLCGKDQLKEFSLPGAERFGTSFCTACGSQMPRANSDPCLVPAGCLDIDPGMAPGGHIFVANKAKWYTICDGLPQHETTIQNHHH